MVSTLVEAEWARVLLCEKNASLAGFLTACLSYSPISACQALFLKDMFVYPKFRSSGVATALMNRMEEWAREQQIGKFFLQSTPSMMALYASLGFAEDVHLRPMSKLLS
jgi:GNAT superfamily N-acetyltransferase